MAIIALSGKKQSGKDTVCKIIQYLIYNNTYHSSPVNILRALTNENTLANNLDLDVITGWKRKLFAGKLKEIVCLLIGCTIEQLEDNAFKETPLGKEWDLKVEYGQYDWLDDISKLTPRRLLQLLGTNCCRDIIHPNTWVNALFADYKPLTTYQFIGLDMANEASAIEQVGEKHEVYPNWIISDTRFANEIEAIEKHNGIVIRVLRQNVKEDNHPSETALDGYTFKYYIDNNGSIPELIDHVKNILISFKIIQDGSTSQTQ